MSEESDNNWVRREITSSESDIRILLFSTNYQIFKLNHMTIISYKTAFRSLAKRGVLVSSTSWDWRSGWPVAYSFSLCLLSAELWSSFLSITNDIVRLRLDSYQQGILSQIGDIISRLWAYDEKDFPEVIDYCRLYDFEKVLANTETNIKYAESKGYLADPSAITMLRVQLIKEMPVAALSVKSRV